MGTGLITWSRRLAFLDLMELCPQPTFLLPLRSGTKIRRTSSNTRSDRRPLRQCNDARPTVAVARHTHSSASRQVVARYPSSWRQILGASGAMPQPHQNVSLDDLSRPVCLKCGAPMSLLDSEDEYPGYRRRMFKCPICGATMTQWAKSPDHL